MLNASSNKSVREPLLKLKERKEESLGLVTSGYKAEIIKALSPLILSETETPDTSSMIL